VFSVSNSQITIEHNSIQLIVVSYLMSCLVLIITFKHDLNNVVNTIFDIEYNTVYASLLSIIFSFCIVLTGFFSRNKYAMLASVRTVLLVLNLEIFLGLLILNLVLINIISIVRLYWMSSQRRSGLGWAYSLIHHYK
jgi:NADH:ubiquinone oxidoreductase subunit H